MPQKGQNGFSAPLEVGAVCPQRHEALEQNLSQNGYGFVCCVLFVCRLVFVVCCLLFVADAATTTESHMRSEVGKNEARRGRLTPGAAQAGRRTSCPTAGPREAWLCVGRRGGVQAARPG